MRFRKNNFVLEVSFVDYQNDLPIYYVNLFKKNKNNKDLVFTGVFDLKVLTSLRTRVQHPELKDLFDNFIKEIW